MVKIYGTIDTYLIDITDTSHIKGIFEELKGQTNILFIESCSNPTGKIIDFGCGRGDYLEAFKRAIDFQGVSSRPEYWYFYLWNVIIGVTVMLIFGEESIPDLIYTLVTVIPSLSVGIRRLHDVGKSGWNLLWVFTIIGIFYILYLLMHLINPIN